MTATAYAADASLKGKLRRRAVRFVHRRALSMRLERPIVSFSFDDAPASALTTGAQVLEAAGVRGTYYVCAGLAGETGPMGRYGDMAEILAARDAGHEIACHTYGHLDCGQARRDLIADDAEHNRLALAMAGIEPRNFAYPYGDVSAQAKAELQNDFRSLRALHAGVVEDGADLNQLPAVGIEGPDGEAAAAFWLARAVKRAGWLILYTHDVAEQPSAWGCTPSALTRLVEQAQAAGCDVLTVDAALDRIGAL